MATTKNKATQTSVDTICFTAEQAAAWNLPEFQRGDVCNANVLALAEKFKADGGVLPGVLHFGVVERKCYLIDGRQRRQAFLLSGLTEGYADTVKHFCDSKAEMAELFFELNSHLVGMKPDDFMRALQFSLQPLADLGRRCAFIGFDTIRRGENSPMLSMSTAIRCWDASSKETPSGASFSSAILARCLSMEESKLAARFYNLCLEAFGREPTYFRMWSGINLTLCAWIYRQVVLAPKTTTRSVQLNDEMFRKCLMALSADATYNDWLIGRKLGQRDRVPAYNRIKAIFIHRLSQETGKKCKLPMPAWAHA